MAPNTIIVNLVGSAQRWRYCSSVEDLVQISLCSIFIQSKAVSNYYPELFVQNLSTARQFMTKL